MCISDVPLGFFFFLFLFILYLCIDPVVAQFFFCTTEQSEGLFYFFGLANEDRQCGFFVVCSVPFFSPTTKDLTSLFPQM